MENKFFWFHDVKTAKNFLIEAEDLASAFDLAKQNHSEPVFVEEVTP